METYDFLLNNVLSELPVNIFLKDTQCRYVFSTHYWRHLKKDSENWSIKGKTDLEIRHDKSNAMLAYNEDKKILETGKGCTYVIEESIDGVTEYLEITKKPVFDNEGNIVGIAGVINDITHHIKQRQHMNEFTSYDMMTGLYSKQGFLDNLYRVFNNNPGKPAVIILMTCIFGDDAVIAYNNILYLANSLRIPLTSDKVCARINQNVFAAAISLNTDETVNKRVERFIDDVNSSRYALTASLPDFAHPKIKKVFDTVKQNDTAKIEELLERLSFDLEEIFALESKRDMSDKQRYIWLREMIYNYPEKGWNIKDITEGMAISKSQFFRTYKKLFMTSCAADIINARIKKASELLIYTDLTISDIAVRCGYNSENYFTHQFRSVTGMTASQYRSKRKE